MPLPRREISDSALLRSSAGELRSTFGETVGAAVTDPLLRPTQLLAQNIEQQQLEGPIEDPFTLTGSLVDEEAKPDPSTFMTPEEVQTEFSELGLEVEEPTPRPVVELKAEQRREQMIREDVIRRGPQDPLSTSLRFGASLAGAAVDPINIASAFMPVVSQARFAGMAARVGPTQARALTGLTEGLAGAAAVEPLTLSLSDDVALDYSMTDALVNVGLGGLLGGGLHVAGGAVADKLRARGQSLQPEYTETADPSTLEGALRASVAHTAEGKDVTVDPLFRDGETERVADPGEPFEQQEAIARSEEAASRTKDEYDIAAAREFDETLELPEDLPEPERAQLEEADRLVADAESVQPSLRAAGECLGR